MVIRTWYECFGNTSVSHLDPPVKNFCTLLTSHKWLLFRFVCENSKLCNSLTWPGSGKTHTNRFIYCLADVQGNRNMYINIQHQTWQNAWCKHGQSLKLSKAQAVLRTANFWKSNLIHENDENRILLTMILTQHYTVRRSPEFSGCCDLADLNEASPWFSCKKRNDD